MEMNYVIIGLRNFGWPIRRHHRVSCETRDARHTPLQACLMTELHGKISAFIKRDTHRDSSEISLEAKTGELGQRLALCYASNWQKT